MQRFVRKGRVLGKELELHRTRTRETNFKLVFDDCILLNARLREWVVCKTLENMWQE